MAKELSHKYHITLKCAEVADARCINRPDNSADAILLMGLAYFHKPDELKAEVEAAGFSGIGALTASVNLTSLFLWFFL